MRTLAALCVTLFPLILRTASAEDAPRDALPKDAIQAQMISSGNTAQLRFRVQLDPKLVSMGAPRICLIPKEPGRPPTGRNPAGGWRSIGESPIAFTALNGGRRSGGRYGCSRRIDESILDGQDDEREMLIQIGFFKKNAGGFFLKPESLSLVRREGVWTLRSDSISRLDPPPDDEIRKKYGARLATLGKPQTTGTRSPIRDVVMAGGGNFLVLRLAEDPCIAIYDNAAGKIVREITTGNADCKVAANRGQVFAAFGTPPQIDQWDLHTGEKLLSAAVPDAARVAAVAAGWRSRGTPLAVVTDRQTLFLDPDKLQPSIYSLPPYEKHTNLGDAYHNQRKDLLAGRANQSLLASGDGLEFVHTMGGMGGISLRLRNGRVGSQTILDTRGGGRLDARGDFLFHDRHVVHLRQRHHPEIEKRRRASRDEYAANGGIHPGTLVPIPSGDVFFNFSRWGQDFERPTVTLSPIHERNRILLVFDSFAEMIQRPAIGAPAARRFWPAPSLGKIITIPADNRRIITRSFDMAAALRKAGDLRHVITSSPRSTAERGSVYTYQIELLDSSRSRKPRFHLRESPTGARPLNAGVSWAIPETEIADVAKFRIELTVEGARDHTFEVDVGGAKPVVAKPSPGTSAADDPPPGLPTKTAVIKTGTLSDEFVIGGSGRYFIYRTIEPPGVGVLDTETREILKHKTFADRDFHLAANHDSLFRFIRGQNLLERRSLPELERQAVKRLPAGADLIAAGSHSHKAPLLLIGSSGLRCVDPLTLDTGPLEMSAVGKLSLSKSWGLESGIPYEIASSRDGRIFTSWARNASIMPVRYVILENEVVIGALKYSGGLKPGGGGRHLFGSATGGIFKMPGFEPITPKRQLKNVPMLIAGADGDYFMALQLPSIPGRRTEKTSIRFHDTTALAEIITLTEFPEMDERPDRLRDQDPRFHSFRRDDEPPGFSLAERFHLLRSGTRLITIPHSNDRLVVRVLDFENQLRALERPFLYMKSAPPDRIRAGQTFRWRAQIASSGEEPSLAALDVPDGMVVSPGGRIDWQVDIGHVLGPAAVLLEMKDASGQSGYFSFTIHVQEPIPSPPDP